MPESATLSRPEAPCCDVWLRVGCVGHRPFPARHGPAVLAATVVVPNQLVITATPGADGNMVAFYQTDNNSSSRLYFTATNWNLSGGSSDNVSWHVHIDFTALGWSSVDKSLVDHRARAPELPGLPVN